MVFIQAQSYCFQAELQTENTMRWKDMSLLPSIVEAETYNRSGWH